MRERYLKALYGKHRPVLEVRARRVGGSSYQVPVEVRPERRNRLRWLVTIARRNFVVNTQCTDRLAKRNLGYC